MQNRQMTQISVARASVRNRERQEVTFYTGRMPYQATLGTPGKEANPS